MCVCVGEKSVKREVYEWKREGREEKRTKKREKRRIRII